MRSGRLAAAGGAVHVLAVLVGNSLYEAGTSGADDGPGVLADLRRPLGAVQATGLVLEVLGLVAFLVFLGALHRMLRRREAPEGWLATTALGAGLVMVAVKLGSAAPILAARQRGEELTTDLARTLVDLNGAAFVVSGLPTGVFVATAAGAALGTGLVPRWLGAAGAVVGVLAVAAGTAGTVDPGGYAPVPFLLCLLWVLVTSAVLALRPAAGDGSAPGHAAQAVPAGAPRPE